MKMAHTFGLPIITLVDTPGAFPGIGSEERHVAEAIAVNLREMSQFAVPIITFVIGEGGSGGALGIAVSNKVYILENAYYSVISPEGCAAILFKDRAHAPKAAEALRLDAPNLLKLGVVGGVANEPPRRRPARPGRHGLGDPQDPARLARRPFQGLARETHRDALRQVPRDGCLGVSLQPWPNKGRRSAPLFVSASGGAQPPLARTRTVTGEVASVLGRRCDGRRRCRRGSIPRAVPAGRRSSLEPSGVRSVSETSTPRTV
jgi:hypothetical protein